MNADNKENIRPMEIDEERLQQLQAPGKQETIMTIVGETVDMTGEKILYLQNLVSKKAVCKDNPFIPIEYKEHLLQMETTEPETLATMPADERDRHLKKQWGMDLAQQPDQVDAMAIQGDKVIAVPAPGAAIREGDAALHIPTGETWYILGVNARTGKVCAAGYPPSIAELADCQLASRGHGITEEERKYRHCTFGDDWDALAEEGAQA